MRPETKAALFNNYLGINEEDVRFTTVDTVLDSSAGRSIVDALSVAPTSGESRLDTWRSYALREETQNAHQLAAELLLAEVVMDSIGAVAQKIPGVIN